MKAWDAGQVGLRMAAVAFVLWAALLIAAVIDPALAPSSEAARTVLLAIVGFVFGKETVSAIRGAKGDE